MSPTRPQIRQYTDEDFTTEVIPLYPDTAPGESPDGDWASLAVFPAPAETANGAGMLVCPGGGYGFLANDHEGVQVAAWFNGLGGTAAVLRYRHAPYHRHPAPLLDAQRAMRLLRSRAEQYRLDPRRLGAMGFSAGGHLASTLGTHFDHGDPAAADPVARQSCRPDVLVLAYPVITTYPPHAHLGSRTNLLGPEPPAELVELLASERQVTAETPPTFLFHTDTDDGVVPENSVLFYLALRNAGVPAELHIYANAPHGVGLCLHDPIIGTWPARLADWLRVMRFLGEDFSPRC